MLVLLLAYSLTQGSFSQAGPIPVSLERRDVASCSDQGSQRTIYGIVWSCLSTIFLCTWVAVHPNISFRPENTQATWSEWIRDPFHQSGWILDPLYHFMSYKLPLFLWALLVPEYILAWAVRQYFLANEIKKKVPGWTRTHGFFMIMGGFHLFKLPADTPYSSSSSWDDFIIPSGKHSRKDDVPICPLEMEDFSVETELLETISPTEIELKDKGKSDVLTKLIVIVQTLWFVIQCITRGGQHLRLTELEVVTLGYAMLNFFIYVFWWDKPRNIECPIRVYKSSTESHYKNKKKALEWDDTPVLRQMFQILEYSIGAQDDFVDMSKHSSIPMFWSGRPDEAVTMEASIGPTTILGAAFGAIQFIAWSYEFPSHAEFVLWRISCVAMTVVPLFATLVCIGFRFDTDLKTVRFFLLIGISFFSLILSSWLYIASRIATLVIALTTLRSLPPSAFEVVDWTYLIPHI